MDFESLSHNDFGKNFLLEKVVRFNPGGELSKRISKVNLENTKDANNLASKIYNDVRRFIERTLKKIVKKGGNVDLNVGFNNGSDNFKQYFINGNVVEIKIYRIGDWSSDETPIVDVSLGGSIIGVNVYDNNRILVKLSNIDNYDKNNVFNDIIRASKFVNDIVERFVWERSNIK